MLAANALIAAALVCLSMATTGQVAMFSHPGDRLLQLHHVPHHLHPGHRRAGPAHRRRFRVAEHCNRRRRDHPAGCRAYIADSIGIHHAFILPAICYLYIVFFAIKGVPRKRASA